MVAFFISKESEVMEFLMRVLKHSESYVKARKRAKLRHRLQWVFFIDNIEGTLDSAVRRAQQCGATRNFATRNM